MTNPFTIRIGKIFAITFILGPPAEDPTWHLLTRSHGGTVSLLHGLTKHECEFARASVLNLPATAEEFEAFADRGVYVTTVTAGTIVSADCFE